MSIVNAIVNPRDQMIRLCKLGFEKYALLMKQGHKERKRGNRQKGRELHWEAGNELETTVGWMLGIRARHNSENTWKWAGEREESRTDWDFINEELNERVDVKACKAFRYGGHIFVEESSKGVTSTWAKEKREGDYLLYVDTDTGSAHLLKTQKLLGVCQRAGRPASGGDDDGANGYTVALSTLKEWGVISASWNFPVYGGEE